MSLSWPEIRTRAATFAREWKDAHYEKGETQSFYNDFFRIFGVERRRVATFEHAVRKLSGQAGFIDLFWPGQLIVEQKSKGRDLFKAEAQAMDYTHSLSDAEMPRFILSCDFQTFHLRDLEAGEVADFALSDLPDHVQRFGFVLGRQTRRFKDQDPVNVKAAELVGTLHDELAAAGYTGHRLEVFLTRIVFCLFADDTGLFEPRDVLWDLLERRTAPDGSDMEGWLSMLFNVLDTPEDARSPNLDPDLARFPNVNGRLFAETIRLPQFNGSMRAALVNACRFDWTPISPAIFGALFQSVMDPAERRRKGAHYTTEKNILKVIEPLFLDDLRGELARLLALRSGRRQRLEAFHDRLAGLTFLDPACGCGNFLIIAYREIRLLEIEVLRALADGQRSLDLDLVSKVDVNQFHGIEYEEFPAEIAKVALYMMDHLMNRQMSDEFGQVFRRLPLKAAPNVVCGDALELDWGEVLPAERCSYVMGNPPFVGAKYQSAEQRAQVRRIAGLGKSGGTLDYVAAWFIKAGEYARGAARTAFVSTNSITQGEQVAQLWPILFERCGLEIAFAHRTFNWTNEARGKAAVHVVIVGLDRRENARTEVELFSYETVKGEPERSVHRALSPYLFDAGGLGDPHLVVREVSRPINGMERIISGSQPIDGGNYILTPEEEQKLIAVEPSAAHLLRPYVAAKDFLQGGSRSAIFLKDVALSNIREMPEIRRRIAAVRSFRVASKRKTTVLAANAPSEFALTVAPESPFLILPKVSSERRKYLPIAMEQPPTIPSDLVFVLVDATPSDLSLLASLMHMAWLREIGGRLKSDYRYSIGLVYNTFPLPDADLSTLEPHAQAILDARANHPDATLADLYDPDLMPADLRAAHRANDRAVDRLYRRKPFDGDRERVEHLFALYEAMTAPLAARAAPKRRRRSR